MYPYVTLTTQNKHIVKLFKVLQINTNNSTKYYSFVSTLLNCPKYCYVSLTI